MLRLVPRIAEETPDALLRAGLPPQLARVLWARGVRTAEEADAFLSPSLSMLHDPFLLRGMDVAVARVHRAVETGERIVVYGDYDVDGVCAAALLVEALRAHGADADWYIPSRHREGYGLNADAVRLLAKDTGLLITVDCGITSVVEAELAKSLGLDLIITDHHEPPETLPDALAIVNPLLGVYPFRRLCGAGVAFKLAQALFGAAAVEPLLELVALATVADLVPLLRENRVLVHFGLAQMQTTRREGLRALLAACGLSGKRITAGHLGFQLGPRINAGGRLYEASRSVELLLTADTAQAERIARALHEENAERQRMEADILRQADDWVSHNVDFLTERVLIIVGQGWNSGVVGLVASRLVERYGWPTVVLSETDGVCTGSARSIPGVNLHTALTRCADLFLRFGGHAQAAGMTLTVDNVPALRVRLGEAVGTLAEPDAYVPSASYDLDIDLAEVTIPLIEQLERLAPTGFGNPSPVFHLSGAHVLEARGVGLEGKHLRLRLAQAGAAMDGIAFGQGGLRAGLAETIDALFSPTINEFQGRRSAQCEIARILPHAPAEAFREVCIARTDDFDCYLLDVGPTNPAPPDPQVLGALVSQALTASCQGTLLTVRTLSGALWWLDWLERQGLSERLDYCFGKPQDARRFNALCAMPDDGAADGYAQVLALDDAHVPEALAAWMPTDDGLRGLYRALRAGQGRFFSENALAQAAGMRIAATRLGLQTFAELGLIAYRPVPFEVAMLLPSKCDLKDSLILTHAREKIAPPPTRTGGTL